MASPSSEIASPVEPTSDTSSTSAPSAPIYRVFKTRWYILSLFALLACFQCQVWNTWGPIEVAVKYGYGWHDSTVAMMANWGTIMFVVMAFPLSYFLEVRGLRETVILVSALSAIGTVIRTFSLGATYFTWSGHICSILNGISGVTVMSAPPVISALWFPPNERAFATAVAQVGNQLGSGVAYLLGPYMVPDTGIPTNETLLMSPLTIDKRMIQRDIEWYMIVTATIFVAILVLVVLYFPSQPSIPPSPSAEVPRTNYKSGLISIAQNPNMWLCMLAYAIPGGVNSGWAAVMTINFAPVGIDEAETGSIALISVLSCAFVTLGSAYGLDHVRRFLKSCLLTLLTMSALFFAWLALLCLQFIPFSKWQIYVSTIGGISCSFATNPLFFEYAVDLAYPISEGLVATFLTAFNNLIGMFFLGVFFIPNIKFTWMNYVLVGSSLISIPLVLLTKGNFRRMAVDDGTSSIDQEGYRIL
eukprot:TCALIF_04084-PA protein Name:"Similar to dirc2 Disrupted in renal carcinoma protein 2 homolog (Xenopus laevis)" AED:0.03 eAED:0.03 QI:0/0/0/1/1/1/2/0/472